MHSKTPLKTWKVNNKEIHFKLDNLQPSQSFKLRGIGRTIQSATGIDHVVSSSGGNAGLAAAVASRQLKIKCTVFVPGSTPESTIRRLEREDAVVVVKGSVWDETHLEAVKFLETLDRGLYVHPFEGLTTWQGHATLVEEIVQDVGVPDVIVCSVGGGGLLCGILTGLLDMNLTKKPLVVAVETQGAASFHKSFEKRELVTLDGIHSIAKSLGAKTVAQGALDLSFKYGNVKSIVVSDKQALDAVKQFANDFQMLVEPACGAALAVVYESLVDLTGTVVVEVCGGFGVTLDLIKLWESHLQ
ncbi:threonine dehydratase [Gorgonomyces haynaldii]|nr:threonine dehydratase [Gorgonomyces haynaldii]